MTPLAAYVLLFIAVGIGFILVHLMIGKIIRPAKPEAEKRTIYECGEPTIGSAWIQFDLRFYVVALLFVIFDVEVAFFFPWAEVFGKANAVAAYTRPPADEAGRKEYAARVKELIPPYPEYRAQRAQAERITQENQVSQGEFDDNRASARGYAWLAFVDILVFFGVLLVGFAYLWRRGDLAWVRSVAAEQPAAAPPAPAPRPAGQALAGAGPRV